MIALQAPVTVDADLLRQPLTGLNVFSYQRTKLASCQRPAD